jgi:hypothetical protein
LQYGVPAVRERRLREREVEMANKKSGKSGRGILALIAVIAAVAASPSAASAGLDAESAFGIPAGEASWAE